jgi:hypothetical protein
MAKTPTNIRSLARAHTETAIRTLATIAANKSAPYPSRVQAATEILNRGYGALVDPTKFEPVRGPKYYVYSIHDEDGRITYIGKGSGYRHMNSARRLNGWPRIRAEFADEVAALKFEARLIKRFKPLFNLVHNRPELERWPASKTMN